MTFEAARTHIQGETKRQKQVYDTKAHGTPFQVGDKVWLHTFQRKKGLSPKLMSFWQGPCLIKEKYSDANYFIELPNGKRSVTHFDRLKPCNIRESEPEMQELNFPDEHFGASAGNNDAQNSISSLADVSATDNHDAQNESILSQSDNNVPANVSITDNDSDAQNESITNQRPRREKQVPAWMHDYVTFNDSLEDDASMEDA